MNRTSVVGQWILGSVLLAGGTSALAAALVSIPAGASITLPSGSLALACADLAIQGTLVAGASQVGIAGNVTIAPGATLNGGAGTITVGGNWANAGAFIRGTSTVAFADGCTSTPARITGYTAFANLTISSGSGRTIIVPVGSLVSVAGTLTLTGVPGTPVHLTSADPLQLARIVLASGALSSITNAQVDTNVSITGYSIAVVDLSVAQTSAPTPGSTGKDVVYALTVTNAGPGEANAVVLTNTIPAGTSFIWASPGCVNAAGTVTCNLGLLANGANVPLKVVVRPPVAGAITNVANVGSTDADADVANNTSSTTIAVNATPTATQTLRYRLYSPVTLEHHFTTDLNEYNVLGSYVGTWIQEGTVGSVLNNPGSFNGVTAEPYFRLYDTSTRWHHWTTDANEYYTLIEFPWWTGEGVDGYILPTTTTGATQLYRLLYPFIGGLHHWTIDPTEYGILISTYGWIGEGGAGFVIQ